MSQKSLTRITEYAKLLMKETLKPGDLAVDATMGNGKDTLFLAKLVGETGKVLAFDIQLEALHNTTKRLKENKVDLSSVSLIHDGHQNIDQYIEGEIISGAMFNLGYLPGGDRNIVTKPETTIISLQKCLDCLKKNGLITIVVYHAHMGGQEEKEKVLSFVKQLERERYHVLKIDFMNQREDSPFLIAIIKK